MVKSCNECEKTYSSNDKLRNHIAIVHRGEKNFSCDKCDKSFGQKNHLKRHTDVVHDGVKKFKCDQCSSSFGQKTHLQKHERFHHGKENEEIGKNAIEYRCDPYSPIILSHTSACIRWLDSNV